jgi:hypothetical protein
VLVSVEGDERVVIEEYKDWIEGVWAAKCYSSCWLPIGSTIRIAGRGVVPSAPLTVWGSFGTTTTLEVKSASSGALSGGYWLVAGGLVTASGAASAGVVASVLQLSCGFSGSCESSWIPVVGTVLVASGVAVISGIVLIVLNSTTHVHLKSASLTRLAFSF